MLWSLVGSEMCIRDSNRIGPLPGNVFSGLINGCERPNNKKTIAASRIRTSHQGALAAVFSWFSSPNNNLTAANRWVCGAGGVNFSSHHKTGSNNNPNKSHGETKAIEPILTKVSPPTLSPNLRKQTTRHVRENYPYDDIDNANRPYARYPQLPDNDLSAFE